MSRPAHNAQLPFPLDYRGKPYDTFTDLWSAVQGRTTIAQVTAGARLRKRLMTEAPSDDLLDECLLLDADAYRARHGVRRSWIPMADGEKDVRELFDAEEGTVCYQLFRQRLKSLSARKSQVTEADVARAAAFSNADWITHYGGGRRKGFAYDGDLHPEARGDYPSFTAFLKAVDRYEDRNTLNRRRKARWVTDDLLQEPVTAEGAPGYIYRIMEISTGKAYVGLSVNRPEVRFRQHLRSARDGSSSALHKALRASGAEAFRLETIEVVDGDETTMAEREVFWIAKIGTLHPEGFNILTGGQIGRYDGLEVEIDGRKFWSIMAMCRQISKETGLAEHVIASCWRKDRPLPVKARVHSDHPEAGSVPFRQWLGILKRAEETGAGVVDAWEDYDTWKADVADLPGEGQLTRRDESRPWGPDNCIRMDHQDIMRRAHGQSFSAFGRTWDTKQDALDHHGIPRNTYLLRIAAGWGVEDALTTPLGPTSKQDFDFDGETFPSRNNACEVLSQRYGMTPHQVKDYLSREIPSDQWPKHGQHVRSGPGVKVAHEVDGTHYDSEADMCRAYGIAKGTYEKRRRNGWTVEQALNTPVKDTTLVIFGFEWSSSKSACKAFGLAPNTYKSRTTKHGMTPEAALMTATARGYAGATREQALEICAAHAIRKVDDDASGATGAAAETADTDVRP